MDNTKDKFKLWMYTKIVQEIMPPNMSHHDRLVHFGELAFRAGYEEAMNDRKESKSQLVKDCEAAIERLKSLDVDKLYPNRARK